MPGRNTSGAPECPSPPYTNGYCAKHYNRIQRHGDAQVTQRVRGRKRKINAHGYAMVRLPEHPAAIRGGWVIEHRYMMEQTLGRHLLPGENVHHINGTRHDNRPENLELWVISQPAGQRVQDLVAWAQEILTRYGDLTSSAPPGSLPEKATTGNAA